MNRYKAAVGLLAMGGMLLGVAACPGDDGNPLRDLCERYQTCEPTDFAQSYDSVDDCEAQARVDLDYLRQDRGEACYDAELDFRACEASLSCSANMDFECGAESVRMEQECM